jgi:hypothetical protein
MMIRYNTPKDLLNTEKYSPVDSISLYSEQFLLPEFCLVTC